MLTYISLVSFQFSQSQAMSSNVQQKEKRISNKGCFSKQSKYLDMQNEEDLMYLARQSTTTEPEMKMSHGRWFKMLNGKESYTINTLVCKYLHMYHILK